MECLARDPLLHHRLYGVGGRRVDRGAELIREVVFQLYEGEKADRPGELYQDVDVACGGLWQGGGRLLAPPTLSAFSAGFQQLFSICREDKQARSGPCTDCTVQIERRVSLFVLNYSKTDTRPPGPVPVWVCAGVCDLMNAVNVRVIFAFGCRNLNLADLLRHLGYSTC